MSAADPASPPESTPGSTLSPLGFAQQLRLERSRSDRSGREFSLIVFDLADPAAAEAAASRIVSSVRCTDAIGRVGETTVSALLAEAGAEGAAIFANRAAASLADHALRTDTFPGLPRPRQRVIVSIAPDRDRFREWVGSAVPEWGSAVAFPESRRIVIQGRGAGSDAGDPLVVFRHELAHLALHEFLGNHALPNQTDCEAQQPALFGFEQRCDIVSPGLLSCHRKWNHCARKWRR